MKFATNIPVFAPVLVIAALAANPASGSLLPISMSRDVAANTSSNAGFLTPIDLDYQTDSSNLDGMLFQAAAAHSESADLTSPFPRTSFATATSGMISTISPDGLSAFASLSGQVGHSTGDAVAFARAKYLVTFEVDQDTVVDFAARITHSAPPHDGAVSYYAVLLSFDSTSALDFTPIYFSKSDDAVGVNSNATVDELFTFTQTLHAYTPYTLRALVEFSADVSGSTGIDYEHDGGFMLSLIVPESSTFGGALLATPALLLRRRR